MCRFVEYDLSFYLLPYSKGVKRQNPTELIFGTDFAHNVNFPGNLGELTGIVFGQSGNL